MRKRLSIFIISVILVSLSILNVYSEDNVFVVFDKNTNLNEEFDSYKKAYSFYKNNINNYDNLLLLENNEVVLMEYGVVEFNNDISEYYSISKKQNDNIAKIYGSDGAYIKTDDDYIYFKIAGDVGKIEADQVRLIPYYDDLKISVYSCDDTYIYHNIINDIDKNYFSYSFILDNIPYQLETNNTYFSYDSHYFYDDFYTMIDDYRNGTYINSVNDEPYYNYFQYLPYRSISNYSYDDINKYLNEVLQYNGKLDSYSDLNLDGGNDQLCKSQLYNEADSFMSAQYLYGSNAMLLLSTGINDSSYGKSINSYTKNNLYNVSAYRNNDELENDRYNSIQDSIYSFARNYISNVYSNCYGNSYYGLYSGNKLGGINVEHSLDSYFGEKVASIYFDIDNKLGNKDINSNCIGIIKDNSKIKVYQNESLNNVIYTIPNAKELSFVIINETTDAYKVYIDYCSDENNLYNFKNNTGYIKKNEFYKVYNKDKISEPDFVDITYDFNGGDLYGLNQVSVSIIKNEDAVNINPKMSGYEFIGYTTSVNNINEDTTLIANYKQIDLINIKSIITKQKDPINLSQCHIYVVYMDSSVQDIPVTSDMISSIEYDDDGNGTITITYNGISQSKDIRFDDNYNEYELTKNALSDLDYQYIKYNLLSEYPYQISEIRYMDNELSKLNDRNYVINNNSDVVDFSISGLDLSLDHRLSFSLIKDTYYVNVNKANNDSVNKVKQLADAYGFEYVNDLNINFKFNYEDIKLLGPSVISIGKNTDINDIYTVYYVDDNGDILKCKTTWSNNYISFVIRDTGDYIVLKKDSFNEYIIDDVIENLNINNMGFDNHKINIEVMIAIILILTSFIGVIIYYIALNIKEKSWREFKNLLHNQDIVQEEKQKN